MHDDVIVDQWGKECHPATGLCGASANTNYCSGQQPCSGGGIGFVGRDITQVSRAEFVADKSKFWGTYTKEGSLKLIGVGGLSAAGLKEGDVLTGIYVVGNDLLETKEPAARQTILRWQFTAPTLNVVFERNGVGMTSTMKNPAAK